MLDAPIHPRDAACAVLLERVHAIMASEGITPSALHAIKLELIGLAGHSELFPAEAFAMPEAEGRTHPLVVEGDDGLGLYLTIGLPGKIAAPHDHGIWCVNAAVSGQERQVFYRRTDDAATPGRAILTEIGEVLLKPGTGMAMSDHDIHSTEVVGDQPAVVLVLYGYALNRFPAVAWFSPQFGTVRAVPSRRHP